MYVKCEWKTERNLQMFSPICGLVHPSTHIGLAIVLAKRVVHLFFNVLEAFIVQFMLFEVFYQRHVKFSLSMF